jgi:hypothetical protein
MGEFHPTVLISSGDFYPKARSVPDLPTPLEPLQGSFSWASHPGVSLRSTPGYKLLPLRG